MGCKELVAKCPVSEEWLWCIMVTGDCPAYEVCVVQCMHIENKARGLSMHDATAKFSSLLSFLSNWQLSSRRAFAGSTVVLSVKVE